MGINLEFLFNKIRCDSIIDFMRKNQFFLLTLFIFSNLNFVYSLDDCPFGETDSNCVYLGDCRKYIDTNNNMVCDRSEPIPGTVQNQSLVDPRCSSS